MRKTKLIRCLFFVAVIFCAGQSQTSYYWVLDNNASRIDVGNKGAGPLNPPTVIPASKPAVDSGKKEWLVSDVFTAGWQGKSADFDMELEVTPQKDADSWAPGGLLFAGNKTANPGANFALMAVTSEYGIVFNAKVSGPDNHQINYSGPVTLPVTIKLTRVGNNLTGSYKDNPEDSWTELGSVSFANGSLVNPDVAKMLFENSHVKEVNLSSGGDNGE